MLASAAMVAAPPAHVRRGRPFVRELRGPSPHCRGGCRHQRGGAHPRTPRPPDPLSPVEPRRDPTTLDGEEPASCDSTPTASCELFEPTAQCDVSCEQPKCSARCEQCTSLPCAECAPVCEPPRCVTHCKAPKLPPKDGSLRVVHCRAPKPECEIRCDVAVECTWKPEDSVYVPECATPTCEVRCKPLPPAECKVKGCEEVCDPLTDCKQTCARPTCTIPRTQARSPATAGPTAPRRAEAAPPSASMCRSQLILLLSAG